MDIPVSYLLTSLHQARIVTEFNITQALDLCTQDLLEAGTKTKQ